ncbi:MAG: hypothetical protein ABS81_10195 [Pseudonocardia sp. SCN 72-86]|nr:MAG: hypothetical protein ABS81_10195 [Pseudonocardia sp. SCN 72-86]
MPDDGGLLDVEVSGVCGADVELFRGSVPDFAACVLGHEVVGRIRALGPAAAARWDVEPGDRVVVNEVLSCGRCELCVEGRGELCNGFFGSAGSRYGFLPVTEGSGLWGGFASVMELHPRTQMVPIADHVPTEVAAQFMPVSNGVHWLFELSGLRPADSVLVIGPGPQGLAVTAVAALAGLRAIVVGRSADTGRLGLAVQVGAARTVDAETEDVVAAVKAETRGRGVDAVVIATSGATDTMATATRCVRVGGTVVVAGTNGWRSEERFKPDALVFRDITVRGAPGHSVASVARAVRLLESGWERFVPLTGPALSIEDAVTALDGTADTSGDVGGVHASVHP